MAADQKFSLTTTEFSVNPRFTKAVVFATAGCLVGKSYDKVADENVAIKAHFNMDRQHWRASFALRDITFMNALHHPNIVSLKNVIGPKRADTLSFILMHMELMEDNLYDYVLHLPSAPNANQIRQWMFQIMNGLHYMHTAGLVHRDLKQNNILVGQNGMVLKITDFDHTRKLGNAPADDLTEIATTAAVRAPEAVVKPSKYSYAIDVWALGCILYFLFNRKLLYNPSTDHTVLSDIISVFGKLNEEDVEDIEDAEYKNLLLEEGNHARVIWKEQLPVAAPDSASDLLEKMLEFSERRRIKLTDALYHDFVKEERIPGWTPPTYSGPEIIHYPFNLPNHAVQKLLRDSITLDMD